MLTKINLKMRLKKIMKNSSKVINRKRKKTKIKIKEFKNKVNKKKKVNKMQRKKKMIGERAIKLE